jgi:hypothetical protein
MAQTLRIKRSGTPAAAPSSLELGEIAINYADGKVFWKNSSGTISSFSFSHAASHGAAGADPVTIATSQISDLAAGANAAARMYLWQTFR